MRPPPDAAHPHTASGGGRAPVSTAEIFHAYLDDYLDAMAELSWTDIVRRQQGLCASLAYGAAGIAYAHWYAGYLHQDSLLLNEAERWIRAALAGQRHRLAFVDGSALPEDSMPAGAYLYGRTGLYLVHSLIARSRGDRRAERRSLARFAELCRATAGGSADLYMGTSGCLAATAILFDHLRDEALFDLGASLCAALQQGAVRPAAGGSDARTWEGLRGTGLAHGPAGAFLAILLWSAAAGSEPPTWFAPSLATLLGEALHAHDRSNPTRDRSTALEAQARSTGACDAPTGTHTTSRELATGAAPPCSRLCSGLSGFAFLAARAAEVLRDGSLLAAARTAANLVTQHPPEHADLCCGRAGGAFALLPLARQDPTGPWRRASHDLALSTLLCDRADWPLTGLYGGEAALACLALNLTFGIDSGPPGLDLITPYPCTPRRRAHQPS